MGAMVDPRSHRTVWSYLRRTRQRLTGMARELPAYAPRLARVISVLAAEEASLISEDPELPFRTNRGPKPFDPQSRDATLAARIAELEGQVRAREEQNALLAHDLRVPLSSVIATLGRLQAEALDPGTRAKLDVASHRCAELAAKLDAMIEGSRLQLGEISLDPEELDLVELIRWVVSDVQRNSYAQGTITVRAPERLTGRWDRARVEQILRNLIANAIQFGAMQPIEITVEGAAEGDFVTMVVRDHGIGIQEQDQKRIFDKRIKLHPGTKGMGLGLWLVRELVQAMGGIVRVDSSPGRGAAFYVTLPRGAAQRMLESTRSPDGARMSHHDGDERESTPIEA